MNKRIIYNNENYKSIINHYDNTESNNYIAPISISLKDILNSYNIYQIEDLELYIKNNLSTTNFLTIKRLFHCWVIVNLKVLKKYINYLIYIFSFIFEYYLHNKIIVGDSKTSFLINDKSKSSIIIFLKKHLKLWIDKHKQNDFYFNIYDDIKLELKKKIII